MFCNQCGTQNSDGARFCSKCGAKIYDGVVEVGAEASAENTQSVNASSVSGSVEKSQAPSLADAQKTDAQTTPSAAQTQASAAGNNVAYIPFQPQNTTGSATAVQTEPTVETGQKKDTRGAWTGLFIAYSVLLFIGLFLPYISMNDADMLSATGHGVLGAAYDFLQHLSGKDVFRNMTVLQFFGWIAAARRDGVLAGWVNPPVIGILLVGFGVVCGLIEKKKENKGRAFIILQNAIGALNMFIYGFLAWTFIYMFRMNLTSGSDQPLIRLKIGFFVYVIAALFLSLGNKPLTYMDANPGKGALDWFSGSAKLVIIVAVAFVVLLIAAVAFGMASQEVQNWIGLGFGLIVVAICIFIKIMKKKMR
ncbi:MAG: zinc ribbon domain-containing protein [Lachnospiraceae bacterium]|nr:zinc ribbon domain-containing protein [Lachnospiraceae bacterium]